MEISSLKARISEYEQKLEDLHDEDEEHRKLN